jgi:ClpP class serine protease
MKTSRQQRLRLISAIEKKRNSKLITYVTSDRSGLNVQIAEDIICKVHKQILLNKISERDTIDLFIYSRGGDSDVPWALVSMIREYIPQGSFNVIIPYKAHSAATVIALGADQIIMTKKGELGPIDATTFGPYNPVDEYTKQKKPISVEDVNGFFNLVDKLKWENNKSEIIKILTDKVEPLALGTVNRILDQTKLVATRLLKTRKDKLTDEEINSIVKTISSEIYSHRHAINRTEGRNYLELKFIVDAEKLKIDKEVWNLYENYSDLFELESPFMPDQYLLENSLEDYTWKDLNLACIESKALLQLCKVDIKVKSIKNVPNQVHLNLNNLALPSINIPGNIPNLDLNAIQTAIKQYLDIIVPKVINDASRNVAKEFLKALPEQGFQRINLSSMWQEIK